MQEQGKRLLLAVALALGVLLAWQWLFPAPKKAPPPPGAGSGSAAALVQPNGVIAMPTIGTKEVVKRGDEQPIKLSLPHAEVTFSSYGGALKSWRLTDKRYEHDMSGGKH